MALIVKWGAEGVKFRTSFRALPIQLFFGQSSAHVAPICPCQQSSKWTQFLQSFASHILRTKWRLVGCQKIRGTDAHDGPDAPAMPVQRV